MLYRKTCPVVLLGTVVYFTFLAGSASASWQETIRPRNPRQDVEGLMEAYVISKLQEALALSDRQYAEMVVAQKRIGEHRRSFRQERARILEQMQRLVNAPDVSDDEITALLKRLEERQEEFYAQQRSDYEAIDAILDVRQRARYRLLEQEIQRRFQQMVREIRRRQAPKDLSPR